MTFIEEAKDLQEKISKALHAMSFKEEAYKEDDVLYMLESIRDMLTTALNDTTDLVNNWSFK